MSYCCEGLLEEFGVIFTLNTYCLGKIRCIEQYLVFDTPTYRWTQTSVRYRLPSKPYMSKDMVRLCSCESVGGIGRWYPRRGRKMGLKDGNYLCLLTYKGRKGSMCFRRCTGPTLHVDGLAGLPARRT